MMNVHLTADVCQGITPVYLHQHTCVVQDEYIGTWRRVNYNKLHFVYISSFDTV